MSQAKMLEGVSETDLKRFALCWLTGDRSGTNWEAASQAYNPESKTESFKTVTGKAATKVLKNADAPATNGDGEAPAAKPKKAAGGKRKKAAAEEGEGDAAEEKPKAKRGKGAAKAKKAKSPAAVTEEEDDEKNDDVKPEEKEESEELV
ncbi:hypothetical protein CLAFUW4_07912 [Fulvia fulva]|uniref:Uncharacterized protein n=1 Tax=Passalora fulva TaxID=5499 RepID=A0A9Q8LDP1_PASFU|nr:uncharacterized protein CLAFUR5_08036 [Fulvia fulva]KAK4628781.1 hypothetical protein CLAFUR4_07917 [Fulvia fulva]KAK4630071.1 hypothetical protein CLAFUR0_07914 [Fulvia fulva]UJO15324.1 hypothetical protein CLAFUR5_08036 [Fulvia fulva]WPV12429.1 hypothetical protein CLAFUW4_07912 [Fulvia fulva]WPV27333.1 hypothetical protein CLAFUW7_07913 [Fulvia fulva]